MQRRRYVEHSRPDQKSEELPGGLQQMITRVVHGYVPTNISMHRGNALLSADPGVSGSAGWARRAV
jgi:hypothetical protein